MQLRFKCIMVMLCVCLWHNCSNFTQKHDAEKVQVLQLCCLLQAVNLVLVHTHAVKQCRVPQALITTTHDNVFGFWIKCLFLLTFFHLLVTDEQANKYT